MKKAAAVNFFYQQLRKPNLMTAFQTKDAMDTTEDPNVSNTADIPDAPEVPNAAVEPEAPQQPQVETQGTDEMKTHLNKYFLGYASVCLVLPRMGTGGPELITHQIHNSRKVNMAAVKRLYESISSNDTVPGDEAEAAKKTTSNMLKNMEKENAIKLLVDPKLVKRSSLRGRRPFTHIEWTKLAEQEESTVSLANGAHRLALLVHFLCQFPLAQRELWLQKVEKLTAKPHPSMKELDTMYSTKIELELCEAELERVGRWLAACYDSGRQRLAISILAYINILSCLI